MNARSKIKWIAILAAFWMIIVGPIVLLFYFIFPDQSRQIVDIFKSNSAFALVVIIFLLMVVVVVIDLFFRLLIMPLDKLVEETALIGTVNSRHRIKADGGPIFGRLVPSINAIAARFEAIQRYGSDKIKSIRAIAEKERNMLAAIMAELPEGVLVCNTNGSILLYNQQAKQLLSRPVENGTAEKRMETEGESFIGLWRSIYDVIDKNQLRHALDEITEKLKNNQMNVVAYFVTMGIGGELLRVETVPVLDHRRGYAGFILIFQDITRHLQTAGQVEITMTSLAREIRTSSASIRATIEAIRAYPDMDRSQLDRFREVIYSESVTLGAIINKIDTDSCSERQTEWPLVQVRTAHLLSMIQKKAKEKLGIAVSIDTTLQEHAIKADTYALTLAVFFILDRIQKENGTITFTCRMERKENFIHFDLLWPGKPVRVEMLREWDDKLLQVSGERLPFTFKEIIRHHGAEIAVFSSPSKENASSLRLFLPACDTIEVEQTRRVTVLTQSRPEFFDFDLFGQAEPSPQVAQRLLSELSYTVFDTETTGLDPSGGDEIIAIGALRIVNGRLLQEESFEQLIDPHRNIPIASTRIHGIKPDMIKDRPAIDKALPRFHRFAADTILVGHNVAFDMRMLQVKEAVTGIKFTNPVLDTLLLSAVVHAAQSDHTMEAIAERLGVSIVGRHTAMGDAVATGKIFLKMLPLLAENGILTLDDAITASKKTFFARIKY